MGTRYRFKLALGVAVLALVAISALYLIGTPGVRVAEVSFDEINVKVADAEVVMDGFSFSRQEDDKSNWRLNAKRAEVQKESGLAMLDDLEAVFESRNGTVLTLTAAKGVFNTETHAMSLTGGSEDIRVSSNSGYEMFLKDMDWDDAKKELATDKPVAIEGENIRLEGGGMVARTDMEELRILNGVKTVFKNVR